MADKMTQKNEYSVAGYLLYPCLHVQLQENKVKFNLFKIAMQFSLFTLCSH